jgi:hypothetical protein
MQFTARPVAGAHEDLRKHSLNTYSFTWPMLPVATRSDSVTALERTNSKPRFVGPDLRTV